MPTATERRLSIFRRWAGAARCLARRYVCNGRSV